MTLTATVKPVRRRKWGREPKPPVQIGDLAGRKTFIEPDVNNYHPCPIGSSDGGRRTHSCVAGHVPTRSLALLVVTRPLLVVNKGGGFAKWRAHTKLSGLTECDRNLGAEGVFGGDHHFAVAPDCFELLRRCADFGIEIFSNVFAVGRVRYICHIKPAQRAVHGVGLGGNIKIDALSNPLRTFLVDHNTNVRFASHNIISFLDGLSPLSSIDAHCLTVRQRNCTTKQDNFTRNARNIPDVA